MAYEISGTVNQDCRIKVVVGNKLIGYKDVTTGSYSVIFPFFKYENFTSLDPVYLDFDKTGDGPDPFLDGNKLKISLLDTLSTSGMSINSEGIWYLSGDFDIQLFVSEMVNISSASAMRLRALVDDDNFVDIAMVETDCHFYNRVAGSLTDIASVNVGNVVKNGFRLVRSGSNTSGYTYTSLNDWQQVGTADSLGIGSNDVFLRFFSARWNSTGAISCKLENFTINSGNPVTYSPFVASVVAENSSGKVLGYGEVQPSYTASAVDITLV